MTRAEKVAVLVEAWARDLQALHGFEPRRVDRRDHMLFLMRASTAQLDSALQHRGIDPATGETPRTYIW